MGDGITTGLDASKCLVAAMMSHHSGLAVHLKQELQCKHERQPTIIGDENDII